jgi:predicted ATPase
MLLVLDNFEQLVSVSGFLSEILSGAEDVKLLVTSREALNLQEEWLYPVSGLAYPFYQDYIGLENYDAVRLFVEQARRVNRFFSVEKEAASIVRICQSLEGIPLALELAASWLKVLACEDIAVEIQRNLEFLESNLRNVPERHRSMRAVFDESWKLLNEDEKQVFQRLSVFQGSFTREAAEKVAAASLKAL